MPLGFVVLAAALVTLGASLTARPAHALSRWPPCEGGGPRGVHVMNAQNSVQWKLGGSDVFFIHDDQFYLAAGNGTRVQRTFEAPDEAFIESVRYRKVYMTHADVSADGTRVAYAVCWDSWLYREDPGMSPPTQESRTVDVPIGVEFFEIAVWSELTNSVEYLAVGSVPVWSPDGTRIAFVSNHNYADTSGGGQAASRDEPGLYTMAADGSDVRHLAPADSSIHSFPPRWSPDGRRLAFVRGAGTPGQAVYTVGADGSDLKRITPAASLPSWSPDGERLALALPDGEEVALYTIAADGSDARRLTSVEGWQRQGWNDGRYEPDPTVAWIETVAWSPDGSKILYTCLRAVCVVDLDGNPVGMSPEDSGDAHGPAWSPDGSRIAVGVAADFDNFYWRTPEVLYTMASDGTDVRVLVRLGVGLVAENAGDEDLATRRAACAAGYVVAQPDKNLGLVRDCRTLMDLRGALFGGVTTNWSAGTPIDEWVGLTIEGSPPRVTGLKVGGGAYGNPITAGIIPPELGDLAKLRTLDLSHNQLSGNIPSALGQLAELQTLDLTRNQLSGRIPPELGDLGTLQSLSLADNRLYGGIPPELGRLAGLQLLNLAGNDLTGGIPAELGNLSSLQRLYLGGNEFAASIPVELGQLAELQVLHLAESGLGGSIPPGIGELAELEILDLSESDLTGDIPTELAGLRNLTELQIADNQLTGGIPWELGWLTKLEELNLRENRLTGRVPVALGGIHSFKGLRLWGNHLEECLPFHLTSRERLHIDVNEWPTCEAGVYAFNVRDDAASGSGVGTVVFPGRQENAANYVITAGNEDGAFAIDPASGRITVMGALDAAAVAAYALTVEAGDGTGDPATVAIQVLPTPSPATCASGIAVPNPQDNPGLVNDCRILLQVREVVTGPRWLNWSAEAPMEQWEAIEIGGTPRRVLALEIRGPHGGGGRIPPELGGLTALQRLVIADNRSWGPVPAELGRLSELRELDLSYNHLSEAIPPELGQLANLTRLSLAVNRLTGAIPAELGQLTSVEELWLRNNRLTGPIPAELGQLTSLRELQLDSNYLTQCLPAVLAVRAREGVTLPDWPTCQVDV